MTTNKIEVHTVYQTRTLAQEALGRLETAYSILAQTGDQVSAKVHLLMAREKFAELADNLGQWELY